MLDLDQVKVAQNSNISARRLGSSTHLSARNHAIAREI